MDVVTVDTPLEPGLYRMADEVYHRRPELSAGIAKKLIHETPAHAKCAMDQDEAYTRATKQTFDHGSAVHDIVQGRQERVKVVEANAWNTKAAKAARAQIEADGGIAILEHTFESIEKQAASIVAQIKRSVVGLIYEEMVRQGLVETTIIANDPADGTPLRAKCDFGPLGDANGTAWILDLKTGKREANPKSWGPGAMRDQHIGIQAVQYSRCAAAVLGAREVKFVFIAAESYPPYCIALYELTQLAFDLAAEQHAFARDLWNRCNTHNHWPGYLPGIEPIEASPWGAGEWEDRKNARNDLVLEQAANARQMEWQAPVAVTGESDDKA